MKPSEYRAIAVWHRTSGSMQYYIDAMQAKASEEGAPADALYKSATSGKWFTLSDLRRTGQPALVERIERAIGSAGVVG